MTSLEIFKTILIGMAIAAPVGPISLLCIRTTLASGFASGFSSGLGAALADGIVCLAALTSLEAFRSIFAGDIMHFIAAAFLLYIGAKILMRKGGDTASVESTARGAGKSFIATFLFTVVNPLTLISFAALFCNSHVIAGGFQTVVISSICIFLGSASWWLMLAAFLTIARRGLGAKSMKLIDIASGLCMLACGLKLVL